MNKDIAMNLAKLLSQQGLKQKQIAEALRVTDRTVRNYLTKPAKPRKQRSSLLDSFQPYIKNLLELNPNYNLVLLFEELQENGYLGQLTILRDYAREVKKKIALDAVVRFETKPGLQAQVDWLEPGKFLTPSGLKKRYAFVMTLGYSRKSFICYTESMKQNVLLACHRDAFEYFGGVPKEILYDNMKTAFIYDQNENKFTPNKKLLEFAVHYGFMPKRCQVRRPQTKGKVERLNRYIRGNFLPRINRQEMILAELNEASMKWLQQVDEKLLRDFNQTRNERFAIEKLQMLQLPAIPFDTRLIFELVVHRDSTIIFKNNQYSVPPTFIGQLVTIKVDTKERFAHVYSENNLLREFKLAEKNSKTKMMHPDDLAAIKEIWEKQKKKRIQRENRLHKLNISKKKQIEPTVRAPSFYDQFLQVGSES